MRRALLLALFTLPAFARAAGVRCVIARGPATNALVSDRVVFSDLVRTPRSLLIQPDNTVIEPFDPARDAAVISKKSAARRGPADAAVMVGLVPGHRAITITTARPASGGVAPRADTVVVGDPARMIQIYDGVNRLAIHCAAE